MMSREIHDPGFNIGEVTAMPLPERARSQIVREALARENYDPARIVADNREILVYLLEMPFRVIGQKLVKGESLAFDEAFLGMTFVVGATNKGLFRELKPSFQKAHGLIHLEQPQLLGPGQTFLTAMAQKEVHGTLTAEEIAGMVAASMMDINLRLGFQPHVLETGGMGGDKGFIVNGERRKVINASTLSAFVLSALEIPVVKHGSYANTSAVGSTEAVEAVGINIYQQSLEEIERLFAGTKFYFSDAHIAKTIHDLSHSPFMRHETINHIVGPMTPPIDKGTLLHKVIGVNEGVHPRLIARAYQILNERGYQKIGNVVVVAGLSKDSPKDIDIMDKEAVRPYMLLDEVSPYSTLLAVVQNGEYKGCFVVTPEDFGTEIAPDEIQVVNTERELLAANGSALRGLGGANSDYLAMNAAIGLFATEYLGREDAIVDGKLNRDHLRACFQRCREAILSGQATRHLEKIVDVSNAKESIKMREKESFFSDVDVVIFDIDNTLVKPHNPDFYRQYSEAVNRAAQVYLGVSQERAIEIANFYRDHYGGGEKVFLGLGDKGPDFSILYDEMCRIDPSGQFYSHQEIHDLIQKLRKEGKKIVALTDSPENLSRRILAEAGFDPDNDFDLYLPFRREYGPPKLVEGDKVFTRIASHFQVEPGRVLSIGDGYNSDIAPAQALGMKTCLVSDIEQDGYMGQRIKRLSVLL